MPPTSNASNITNKAGLGQNLEPLDAVDEKHGSNAADVIDRSSNVVVEEACTAVNANDVAETAEKRGRAPLSPFLLPVITLVVDSPPSMRFHVALHTASDIPGNRHRT